MTLNFEVASSSSFRNFPKRSLFYVEAGGSSDIVNAICSRPEVVDDVISGEDVEASQDYICVNL